MSIKIFLLLFLFMTSLTAVPVTDTLESLDILPSSEIYVDSTAKMDFDTVNKQPFHPFDADFVRLGYTHDAVFIRFALDNLSDRPLQREIVLDNCMLDSVTLYRPDGSEETTGVLHKPAFNGSRLHPYFALFLPPHAEKTYILRSQTDSCAQYFRLKLLTPDAAWSREQHYQLAMALFFGALLSLIVYNLFIWIFTRERVYIYYVLYLSSWIITHISFSCMGQHFYGQFPWFLQIDAFLGVYYNTINAILAILFFKTFFHTPRNYPKINLFFNAVILYFLLLSLFSSIWTYEIEVLAFSLVAAFSAIALLLFYWLLKGVAQIRFIFAGWLIAIGGIVSMAINQFGIPNPIDHWRYFFEFSIVAEALLFSVALAARLNKTKALEQALTTQKVLLQELNHRVKNNMQTIISMYRLKLAGASEENLKAKMDEVERTVQSMSRIHEMLYLQEDIAEVDAASYFSLLIDQLQRSAPPNVSISFHSNVHLSTDRAIYCAIIVNELVTNALKHAFDEKGGTVKVGLYADGGNFVLQISDAGRGMHTGTDEGFGLSLVRAFAEEELKAILETKVHDGTTIRIIFKK